MEKDSISWPMEWMEQITGTPGPSDKITLIYGDSPEHQSLVALMALREAQKVPDSLQCLLCTDPLGHPHKEEILRIGLDPYRILRLNINNPVIIKDMLLGENGHDSIFKENPRINALVILGSESLWVGNGTSKSIRAFGKKSADSGLATILVANTPKEPPRTLKNISSIALSFSKSQLYGTDVTAKKTRYTINNGTVNFFPN